MLGPMLYCAGLSSSSNSCFSALKMLSSSALILRQSTWLLEAETMRFVCFCNVSSVFTTKTFSCMVVHPTWHSGPSDLLAREDISLPQQAVSGDDVFFESLACCTINLLLSCCHVFFCRWWAVKLCHTLTVDLSDSFICSASVWYYIVSCTWGIAQVPHCMTSQMSSGGTGHCEIVTTF